MTGADAGPCSGDGDANASSAAPRLLSTLFWNRRSLLGHLIEKGKFCPFASAPEAYVAEAVEAHIPGLAVGQVKAPGCQTTPRGFTRPETSGRAPYTHLCHTKQKGEHMAHDQRLAKGCGDAQGRPHWTTSSVRGRRAYRSGNQATKCHIHRKVNTLQVYSGHQFRQAHWRPASLGRCTHRCRALHRACPGIYLHHAGRATGGIELKR
jgi:hypothetical protein